VKVTKRAKDTDYLSISARIRAMEGRLLTAERRERMIDAHTDEEALKLLAECGYAEPENAGVSAVDAVLAQARAALFEDLKAAVPNAALVEVFQIKYDIHNAKALLKGQAVGEDAAGLLMRGGRYEGTALAEAVSKGDLSWTSPTFQAAVKAAGEALESGDPQGADAVLDRACFQEMTAAAKGSGSKFLQGYVRASIDAANLRTAVRCARMGVEGPALERLLLPGGEVPAARLMAAKGADLPQLFRYGPLAQAAEVGAAVSAPGGGSLTEFERLCDNALTGYLSAAKRVPFGEQPVVGYLCAREAEATTVRTIMALRSAGLSGDAIRERLRDSYV